MAHIPELCSDLKPENVFITLHGTPKIADFGFAKTETMLPENANSSFLSSHFLFLCVCAHVCSDPPPPHT